MRSARLSVKLRAPLFSHGRVLAPQGDAHALHKLGVAHGAQGRGPEAVVQGARPSRRHHLVPPSSRLDEKRPAEEEIGDEEGQVGESAAGGGGAC